MALADAVPSFTRSVPSEPMPSDVNAFSIPPDSIVTPPVPWTPVPASSKPMIEPLLVVRTPSFRTVRPPVPA